MHLDGVYIEVIVALSSHCLQLVSQLVNLLLQGLHNCGWNGVKDKLLVLALQGLKFFTQIMILLVQVVILVLQPLVKVSEGFCILQSQASIPEVYRKIKIADLFATAKQLSMLNCVKQHVQKMNEQYT